MLEFILFVIILILLFWIGSVSRRVSILESKQRIASVGSSAPVSEPESRGFLQPKILAMEPILDVPLKPAESMMQEKLESKSSVSEADTASNWLNRIGVVALLFGMVFFFKYAIDQGWINPWMRIIIGFAVSGLLVYLGNLWREKYGSRALALSGGGIALFYFTIFAAYQFYQIMPQPVAWFLMLCVAAMSVWLSFKYSSLTMGILGFFGAYGSPLMLSSGQNQQAQLFIYLSVLNIAALAICIKKYFSELIFLSILGSIIDYAVWAGNYSNYQNTFPSLFFVIFTAALLTIGSIILFRRHKGMDSLPDMTENNLALLHIFAGIFYFIGAWQLLNQNFYSFLAPIALLGAIIFFFAYALVDRLEYKSVNYCLSFVASWMLLYAAVWQFHGKALGLAFLAIALLGASLGFLLKREELRVWGLCVLLIALFKSLIEPYGAGDAVFLFNAKFGLMLANTLSMFFVGWLYGKFKPSEFEKSVEEALQFVGALVLWFVVWWDMFSIYGAVHGTNLDSYMSLWWIVYPAALAWVAYAGKRTALMTLSVLLLAASFIKVLVLPYGLYPALFFNAKFGLMLAESLAILGVGMLYAKQQEKMESADAFYAVAASFFWFTVSWEIVEYFSSLDSTNARNLILSLWWIVYAVVLMVVSGFTKRKIFRQLALILFGMGILKVFLYDVQVLDTPYRIVAFIVLGVILLSVSFSYNKNKEKITEFIKGQ